MAQHYWPELTLCPYPIKRKAGKLMAWYPEGRKLQVFYKHQNNHLATSNQSYFWVMFILAVARYEHFGCDSYRCLNFTCIQQSFLCMWISTVFTGMPFFMCLSLFSVPCLPLISTICACEYQVLHILDQYCFQCLYRHCKNVWKWKFFLFTSKLFPVTEIISGVSCPGEPSIYVKAMFVTSSIL